MSETAVLACDPPSMHLWLEGRSVCQCGQAPNNPVPTPEHIARIRRLWEDYARGDVDLLTVNALIWQIPGLLLRIDFLEATLRNLARDAR